MKTLKEEMMSLLISIWEAPSRNLEIWSLYFILPSIKKWIENGLYARHAVHYFTEPSQLCEITIILPHITEKSQGFEKLTNPRSHG